MEGQSNRAQESGQTAQDQPAPAWQKTATTLVYILLALAFAYIGYGYYTQKVFARLMADVDSSDEAVSKAAEEQLVEKSGAMPYLVNALVNSQRPEKRVLCANIILRRVRKRAAELPAELEKDAQQKQLRSGLNLEAITQALQDESSEVRDMAAEIVQMVGMEQNYQRNRLQEKQDFQALLDQLRDGDAEQRTAAAEQLREAGIRSFPYVVGVVFSKDEAYKMRGLRLLSTVVQDVLRGSNQQRIVPQIGRRRCQLLLEQYALLQKPEDRKVITDLLNVSGRVPPTFFEGFVRDYNAAAARDAQMIVLRDYIAGKPAGLESLEKLQPARAPEVEKVEQLHDKGGR